MPELVDFNWRKALEDFIESGEDQSGLGLWLSEEIHDTFVLVQSEDGTPLSGYVGKAQRINLYLQSSEQLMKINSKQRAC